MIRRLLRLLFPDRGGVDRVSDEWRESLRIQEMRETWQGPRWRSPKEIARMRRQDARAGLRVVAR